MWQVDMHFRCLRKAQTEDKAKEEVLDLLEQYQVLPFLKEIKIIKKK